ncbi:MAG: DNA recombination protein RmuC [Gammaproteobacteria bacterium]|nr:DNA recombination protein RmuC [Gammaproteobacteria bacterium]
MRLDENGKWTEKQIRQTEESLRHVVGESQQTTLRTFYEFKEKIQAAFSELQIALNKNHLEGWKLLQESSEKSLVTLQQHVSEALKQSRDALSKSVGELTQTTAERLSTGFEKTTATFSDVVKRLVLIDEAQKKITELSGNVVSLQEILVDKRARGAFGEIQLQGLIRNVLPEAHFSFQHTFGNGKRADCVLFLPPPTGTIAIDAKFPLENYQKMMNAASASVERKAKEVFFQQDIKRHIQDIASKYIIPGETTDSAVMFIPAESVFSEIHSHYPELIEMAYKNRVWLVSPTTLMAVLTTARAVIQDEATRKQVHIIQEHLRYLSADFVRFQTRIESLSRHIQQVHADVDNVHTSAQKITHRFQKIEKAELADETSSEGAIKTPLVEPATTP